MEKSRQLVEKSAQLVIAFTSRINNLAQKAGGFHQKPNICPDTFCIFSPGKIPLL